MMKEYSVSPISQIPRFRRVWKPAVVTGVTGTAAAIWFDELILYAEEILALIVLPLMAGIIYLYNLFVFQSRMPDSEEYRKFIDTGA
jgi:hypothetical protein